MLSRRSFIEALAGASALAMSGCLSLPRRPLKPDEVARLGLIKEIHAWTDGSTARAERILEGVFRQFELGTIVESECPIIVGADDEDYPESSIVRLVFQRGTQRTTLVWYDGGERLPEELVKEFPETEGLLLVGEQETLLVAGATLDGAIGDQLVSRRLEEALAAIRTAQLNPGRVIITSP